MWGSHFKSVWMYTCRCCSGGPWLCCSYKEKVSGYKLCYGSLSVRSQQYGYCVMHFIYLIFGVHIRGEVFLAICIHVDLCIMKDKDSSSIRWLDSRNDGMLLGISIRGSLGVDTQANCLCMFVHEMLLSLPGRGGLWNYQNFFRSDYCYLV